MPRFTKQQLDLQLKKLPEDLKDAVFSVDIASKMYEIGRSALLTIEKTGFLAEETGYVMLGLVRPEEFIKNLETRLDLDEEETRDLAGKINKEIFYPIRETMKRAHRFEINDEEKILSSSSRPSFSKLAQELREEVKKEFPSEKQPIIGTAAGSVAPDPAKQNISLPKPEAQVSDIPLPAAVYEEKTSVEIKAPELKIKPLFAVALDKNLDEIPSTAGIKISSPAEPAPSVKSVEPDKKNAYELFTQKPISRDTFAIKKEVKPEAQPGTITSFKLEPKPFMPPPPRPLPHEEERRPLASIIRPVTEEKKVPTPPPAPLPPPPAPPSKVSQKPTETLAPVNQTFGVGETKPDVRPSRPSSPPSFAAPKTSDWVRDSGAGLAIAEKTFPPESIRPPLASPKQDPGLSAPPSSLPIEPVFSPPGTPLPKVIETKKEAQPMAPPSQGKQNYIAKDPYREAVE